MPINSIIIVEAVLLLYSPLLHGCSIVLAMIKCMYCKHLCVKSKK